MQKPTSKYPLEPLKNFYLGLLLSLVVFSGVCIIRARASDPDPLKDFVTPTSADAATAAYGADEKLSSGEFVIRDVFKYGVISKGPGGVRAALNTEVFPAMGSQGLTYVQFKMRPCGVNLPHTHPRAAEMLTLISGGPLQVGFVDTSGKAHIDVLKPGDVTIFPRGLMHFELNVGTETAFFISALNSQNPGTLPSGNALFKLPKRAAAASMNVDFETVEKIEEKLFDFNTELQLAATCVPGKDVSIDV